MGLQGFQAANPINSAVADMRRRHVSKLYTPTESVASTKHAKRHTIALQYFSSAELLEMAMERERERELHVMSFFEYPSVSLEHI